MSSPQKHNPTSKRFQKYLHQHFAVVVGFLFLTFASLLIATDTNAATGINEQISFQGKVVNTNGTNVANGSYTFVFRLYDVDTGGTHIWTESKSLTVTDGIFQTNLGDTTTLPGSVDFNTDNIYLGINFNSDGEMSPRVRFTAAPYALNAAKVGGLTVTDTTGTLTIPNGKTISFSDAFTTTGAFPLTLTSTASTTATLPSGTITLVDLATSQSLTNKTIGSTGLAFSGATTDITTATGEDLTVVANGAGIINLNDSVTTGALTISGATTDITTASGESLVIVANGAGVIDLQDATTVDSLTTDTGGVSIASGQAYTGAGAVTLSSAATTALTVDSGTTGALNLGTGNNTKTISLGTGTAGNTINIATDNTTSDTIAIGSALDNVAITGDSWSITDAGALTVVSCSGCGGGGGTLDSAYTAGNTIGTDSGSNVIINLADVATPTEVTINNLDASGTNALQIDNSTTLTNGLFIEQSAAGTLTNAIQIGGTAGTITNGLLITDGAGAITNGIQLTGTFTTTLLDTPSLDISGAGAITGATGITSATGDITATAGNIVLGATTRISNTGVGTLITGTVIGSQTFTTNNIADSGALTIASGAATALTLNSGTTGDVNIGSDTSAESILIGTGVAAKTITIGNASDDTFSINSSGLNVTSGGALTGVASIDTIAVSATAITFAGTGTVASTTTGLTLDSGSNTLTVAASDTTLTASGITTLTLGTNTTIGSAGTITLDSGSNTIIPDADTFQTNDVTSTGALTLSAGSTAQNITLTPTTTGYVTVTSSTGTSDTIRFLPATGAATFAGIITTADLTASDKTYTFPNATITVNAAGDISGTTLASNVTGSSLTSVGTLGSLTVSGAIAANGGITFDAATDTVGAFTAAGTIDMSTNIITNIGNAGTDFVASTGALTLAGVLTANGGITLASSQIFTASSLSYMDLGAVTHGTTAVQGLRLPQAASASPSSPTSGEGYLAWDAGGNQVIYYNGSAWATFGAGGGYATIKDESTSLTQRTTLAFLGAGVSCADNVTQTECTISGGAGSDLQGTYGADADGSNATISLTAADDGLIFTNPTSAGTDSAFLLQLTQQNTTAAVTVLDMVQSSNAANGASLVANAIDTETGLVITTNGLTSGKGISITSSSTAFTGNLADVQLTGSDAANTGNVLAVSNTGTANTNTSVFVDHRATGTGNLAVRVNDESGDTTPFIIDGNGSVGIGTSSIAAYNGVTSTTKLQVGSATNRGDAVVYGDYLRKGLNDYTALTNIQSIFVYDTTRDSDGGAWINSLPVQGSSWYNETKDDGPGDVCALTDDRCGRAAFPRKSILVATTSAMYIFDAQDGGMWMKFDQDTAGSCVTGPCALGTNTNNDPSSVFAVNGVVYVGTKGSSGTGMYAIDFYNDRLQNFDSVDRTDGDKNIANRNTVLAYSANAITALSIFSNVVNDVHGAVMYGSSITQTNGGPLNGNLFVAVATDDAAQVINMSSGKVLRYADGATTDDINQVWVTRRGRMYLVNETLAEVERYNDIETSVANDATPDDIFDEATGNLPNAFKTAPTIATTADALWVIERETYAESTADTAKADVLYVGHSQGLTEIHDVNAPSGTVIGWSKFYNTDRVTPYMSGTPRGMFSFNESTGDLVDSTIRNNVLEPEVAPTYGVNGVFGTGLSFNGSTQFLCSDTNNDGTCDVDTDFDTAAISFHVSLWFKHGTTLSGTDVLVDKRYPTLGGAEGIGYTIEMNTSGFIVFGIQDTAATAAYDDSVTSTLSYADNEWHHLVAVNTDTAICLYVDGRLAVACDATLGATATLSGNILTVGADGSTASGGNFWEGQIDDLYFAAGGATTSDTLTQAQARRMYNNGRQALARNSARVTDATTTSTNTIGDSGEAWRINQFAGSIVEITSDTGAGQSRRVTGNTATTLTVSPNWSTTPSTDSDFEVIPEQLYGDTNTVTSVAVTDTNFLGKMRELYVGTSNGSDGGGISVFQGYGNGYVTDVFHSDTEKTDDGGTEWTGTDYDDVTAIGVTEDTVAYGSLAGLWVGREDESFDQSIDQLMTNIDSIQKELLVDGLLGTSPDTGVLGGADLAERYYSNEPLQAGEVVSIDTSLDAGVKKSASAYQRDIVGVVATTPGIILGPDAENGYPIALVGRVPVKVTNQNGWPAAGERLVASNVPGYAMRATQAGRVLGQVLQDPVPADFTECPAEYGLGMGALCGTAVLFVNLSDYYGQPVELAMAEREAATEVSALETSTGDEEIGLAGDGVSVRLATAAPTREEKLLAFLREIRDERARSSAAPSEVFTDRVAASTEIITPTLIVDQIFAKSIKADSIEGLQIFTDQLSSLSEKYAGLEAAANIESTSSEASNVAKEQLAVAMKNLSVDTLTVQMDGSVLGKLSVAGALTLSGPAEFRGETLFSKLATFLDETVFQGRVKFASAPTFGTDTAGFATIEKGRKKVHVTFDQSYEEQPIVTITLTRDVSPLLDEQADAALRADVAMVEADFAETMFDAGLQYVVTEKDKTGFTILLSKDAPSDLSFSWIALAVKDAKSFASGKAEESKVDEPTLAPAEIPDTSPGVLPTSPVTEPVVSPAEIPPATEPTVGTTEPIPATT
ncbi:MAG: LamG-like jellyroll fold domain-containing protein [Candidatus Moraniibacteriota bacterium]